MGNITVGMDGIVNFTRTFDLLTLGGSNSIIGRAVVVHQLADDGTGSSDYFLLNF
jgi:Cu/Zn superoxide dismutase